jgi:5'-3' exonuclease
MKEPLIIVIDAGHICNSAKHAMKGVDLTHQNINTGVIYTFLNQVSTFITKFKTRRIVFCWDSRTSKRQEIYPEYKANRKDISKLTEEDIIYNDVCYSQFAKIREDVLPSIGFKNNFYQDGYEADDLIAALVSNLSNCKICVVANDHDLFQFLSDKTFLYDYRTKTKYTDKDLFEEFDVTPIQWAEMLTISGCITDNVKGVVFDYKDNKPRHIGKTVAIKYIKGKLPRNKAYTAIVSETGKRTIERNRKLVCLPFKGTTIPRLVFDEEFYLKDFEAMCEKYGFYSFLKAERLIAWRDILGMK